MPWVPEVIQGAVRQGCWVKVMLQPMLWPGWPSVSLLVSAGSETLQDLLSPLSMGTAASQPVGFSLKAGKLRYRDLFIPPNRLGTHQMGQNTGHGVGAHPAPLPAPCVPLTLEFLPKHSEEHGEVDGAGCLLYHLINLLVFHIQAP